MEEVISGVKGWLKDFVHNCIVHPLMMFLPREFANEMHDRNADWAFGEERFDELELENQKESEQDSGEDHA